MSDWILMGLTLLLWALVAGLVGYRFGFRDGMRQLWDEKVRAFEQGRRAEREASR